MINLFELYYGAYKYGKDVGKLDEFVESIETLPFTSADAKKQLKYREKLERWCNCRDQRRVDQFNSLK